MPRTVKRIKPGDWVKFVTMDGFKHGYVINIDWMFGWVRIRAINFGNRRIIHANPEIVFPYKQELTANDLDDLIDLSLAIEDKEWFMELSSTRKLIRS
ncbi:hypothetical protein J9303_00375 [Bacillaceae bacterium Marseille-Q3522]|nr:hypothetical protein [Bacillaceae bacterium Marseille-Q3522]